MKGVSETTDCRVTELDLVALNGRKIVVVEVKTTATKKKVSTFLRKFRAFRKAFLEYGNRTDYGAMAYLTQPEGEGASAADYAVEKLLLRPFYPKSFRYPICLQGFLAITGQPC